MIAPVKGGGPAFPASLYKLEGGQESVVPHEGMTLRDWFAGQALAGLCVPSPNDGPMTGWEFDRIAPVAWKAADAMLAAREGGK